MNRELRPSCCVGLHDDPTTARPHQYAKPITAVRRPARSAKNAGESPQNSECVYGLGRNDPAYAIVASTSPAPASHLFKCDSATGVRAPSSSTPMHPPANTNAAHGNMLKCEYPGGGRRYASSASGKGSKTGVN